MASIFFKIQDVASAILENTLPAELIIWHMNWTLDTDERIFGIAVFSSRLSSKFLSICKQWTYQFLSIYRVMSQYECLLLLLLLSLSLLLLLLLLYVIYILPLHVMLWFFSNAVKKLGCVLPKHHIMEK